MADKTLEQMLEHLVNDEKEKAEELFHEYVVAKSREIYESLIEAEEEDDEEVDEAKDEEDEDKVEEAKDEEVSEELFDITPVGEGPAGGFGGDETDDLAGEIEMDMDGDDDMGDDDMGGDDMDMGDEGGEDEEAVMQDLEDIIGELQAKFDELKGEEADQDEFDMDAGADDMDDGEDDEDDDEDDDDEMKDSFDQELATVREYVEKVAGGHGAEKKGAAEQADNTKSLIDNMKNDMGGTTANILSGKNGSEGSETGALKGNGLLKGSAKEDNAGNINVPGGKAGGAFSKKEPGHGAEKKGSAESADNKQSLFRGRR